jgi:hypothetical protein
MEMKTELPETWRVGERVRFVGAYAIPCSPESLDSPNVEAGAVGVVVRVNRDSIWVEVARDPKPVTVTLWFEEAFPDDFAKTTLLSREPLAIGAPPSARSPH